MTKIKTCEMFLRYSSIMNRLFSTDNKPVFRPPYLWIGAGVQCCFCCCHQLRIVAVLPCWKHLRLAVAHVLVRFISHSLEGLQGRCCTHCHGAVRYVRVSLQLLLPTPVC